MGDRLLGGTAARIVRHAKQPVLAVRRRTMGPYASVAVAVDFSEPSQRAFRCARSLFAKSQFSLVDAYAVTPDYSGRNADRPLNVVESEEKACVVRKAEQDMADLIGSNRQETNIETVLKQGSPESVMAAYVDKQWQPDLVVAGAHGQSGMQQSFIGSVAEGFLRSLSCDVLAVPTRQ